MKTNHILSHYPNASQEAVNETLPAKFMFIGMFMIFIMGTIHGLLCLTKGIPIVHGFAFFSGGYISGFVFLIVGLARNKNESLYPENNC